MPKESKSPKGRGSGPLMPTRTSGSLGTVSITSPLTPPRTSDPLGKAREQTKATPRAQPAKLVKRGAGDYQLFAAVGALLCFGLVMVYSASATANYNDPSYWLRRELLWVGLGVIAMLITTSIPYKNWGTVPMPGWVRKRLHKQEPQKEAAQKESSAPEWGVAVPALVSALLLLVLVLVIGRKLNGGQRWLPIGPFTFQPSELAKLALTLYIADWLNRKDRKLISSFLKGAFPFAVLTGVVIVLVILQNDLGTAIIIACFAVAMFIAAGANLLHLVPMAISGLAAGAYLAFSTPFRAARLEAFLHPLDCASNNSYQVCQGLIALGSGGLTGLGLGASRQKAGFLPNPWTDSIFAVIGEELGFIGCVAVLALIGFVVYRAFQAGQNAPNTHGALLATGFACWIAVQSFLNIGSVVALIPFTGVPLPFISFGGSSLVTTMAAMGILLNISRYSQHPSSQKSSSGIQNDASTHFGWRDWGTHLPGAGRR